MRSVIPTAHTTAADNGVIALPNELIALRHPARGLASGRPKRVTSPLAGSYLSRIRGRGLDFDEVRSYQQGDDVRNIDWRVTARTGQVHSKVFNEERERPVWLLYDGSPSMRFGTRVAFKSVAAARAAALIAWSAQLSGDRVGAVVASAGSVSVWPPAARENRLLLVLGAIAQATSEVAASGTDGDPQRAEDGMPAHLERLRQQVRPGSRVFVVSDFYGFDAAWQQPLAGLARRNQVTCLWVLDALEVEAPPPGRYRISDGKDVRSFAASAKSRDAFAKHFEDRRDHLTDFCRGRNIELHSLRTDDDAVAVVAASLEGRASRAQRRA